MDTLIDENVATQTVAGLFDDRIDAEHALTALRKRIGTAISVSVLARDPVASGESDEHAVDVTKAMVDTAFSTVAGWLSGLAALMVPNRGSFLAAGPIGIALAKDVPRLGGAMMEPGDLDPSRRQVSRSLSTALEWFGFQADEAHYIEERLAAGSAMIAVTTADDGQLEGALQTFADFNAVFVGQAMTPDEVLSEVERWLENPLTARSSDIIVADVVAAMGHVCGAPDAAETFRDWCGRHVFDRHGERVGAIDDVLTDAADRSIARYVVIGHGGLLGLARRRVAIPAELVYPGDESMRLAVTQAVLREAPDYLAANPFSRKDELAIHAYFETHPYWSAV